MMCMMVRGGHPDRGGTRRPAPFRLWVSGRRPPSGTGTRDAGRRTAQHLDRRQAARQGQGGDWAHHLSLSLFGVYHIYQSSLSCGTTVPAPPAGRGCGRGRRGKGERVGTGMYLLLCSRDDTVHCCRVTFA